MSLPLNYLRLFVEDEQPEQAAAVLAAEGRIAAHADCAAVLIGLAACLDSKYEDEAKKARLQLRDEPESAEAAVYIIAANLTAAYCAVNGRPEWQAIYYVHRLVAVAEYSWHTAWLAKLASAVARVLEVRADAAEAHADREADA